MFTKSIKKYSLNYITLIFIFKIFSAFFNTFKYSILDLFLLILFSFLLLGFFNLLLTLSLCTFKYYNFILHINRLLIFSIITLIFDTSIYTISTSIHLLVQGIVTHHDQKEYISSFSTLNSTSGITNNNMYFLPGIIIFCLALIFLKLSLKKKPLNSFQLYKVLFFICVTTRFHSDKIEYAKSELRFCTKVVFFPVEFISLSNVFSEFDLKFDLIFMVQLKNHPNFFQFKLILSGDINLHPGPVIVSVNDIWEPFKKRGMHILHININSLLPKINELREIAKKTNATVIGVTESKLDDSINNSELHIVGYSILRCDRNRKGGGVACYIRNDICFNREYHFSDEIEYIFSKIFIPNVKPISIGIFYRPPNENMFFDKLINSNSIDVNKNEIYVLGDFNINLLENNKYILNEGLSCKNNRLMTPLIRQYIEFFQSYSLKQILREPTHITM